MRIDSEVLAAFLHMQELDVQIIRAEKQLQELPERKAVADAMAKRRAVAAKAEQVEKLAAKAEDKLARITEEDDGLAGKARRIQDEIEQAQGDFRTVDARTKELTGVQERRDALEEDMRAVDAELEKIKAVRDVYKRQVLSCTHSDASARSSAGVVGISSTPATSPNAHAGSSTMANKVA